MAVQNKMLKNIKTMKTTNKMITMKTSLYILTAFLGMQYNLIFAGNESEISAANASPAIAESEFLAPSTPKVASFEDAAAVVENMNMKMLMPVTPKEADFSDGAPEPGITTLNLVPVTPKEATFEEVTEPDTNDPSSLAPAVPAEADFEDASVSATLDTASLSPVIPATADFEEQA